MTPTPLPWSLLALCTTIVLADTFPYNPTRALRAPNSSFVYLFQPSSQGLNQGVLRTISLSNGFDTGNLPLTTIADSLPFLKDDTLVPYTPMIDEFGNITVVAGSCASGAEDTALWRFTPDPSSAPGNGSWVQYDISERDLPAGSNLTGTNFLASGVAFSGSVAQDDGEFGYYLFGGMCPFSSDTTATNWVNDSAYSNTMLQFARPSAGEWTYGIDSIASRGPPVAEAGFTMTGLTPTFSMNASGGPQSQQQDFLLLGGHTQQAFINMSNVALFSLPQESWAFVAVDQPSGVKTDLATRQAVTEVEPRSGHTAVLSEDGTSIIVLGGWVGDVTNPAQPQIAVLHLGSEYGGDEAEAWTWTVPTSTGNAVPPGTGIYGHGATMLDGGIMMVAGGYSITASSSRVVRRAQTSVDGVYLYNTTSHAWIDSYAPPSPSASADNQSSGPLSKTSEQAGLGVGLGVGVAALVGVTCFYFWYTKRLRQQREDRERELLAHSSGGSFMQLEQPYAGHGDIDGHGGDPFASHQDYSTPMEQADSTSLFLDVPSPNRGLRKGLQTRPYMYHQAPRYDERRLNQGSGNIHPIPESADEDRSIRGDDDQVRESAAVHQLREIERVLTPDASSNERSLRDLQRQLKASSLPHQDPFADPEPHANPLGSNPVSPITETVRRVPTGASRAYSPTRRPVHTEPDGSMNWMVVDDEDALTDPSSSSNGRASPTRADDRTSSTLSEQSHRSHASSNSITRTMSTRTGALLSAALAARNAREEHDPRSPGEERTSTMGTKSSSSGRKSPYYFDQHHRISPTETRTPGAGRHYADKSQDSFTTAKSTFAQLQDEGQALLGGRPMADRDDPYQRAMAATTPHFDRKESIRDYETPPRRKQGWIGSLRRALTAVSNSERSFSLTSNTTGIERPYEDEPRTSSSSPTRTRKGAPLHPTPSNASASGPRRAVSDGSTLLRHKRGRSDWENDKHHTPYCDDPDPGDWGEPARTSLDEKAAENEWDVEGEASKRDVQVMFTVPKARLRVVNADVERASLRSASEGAVSRSGSLRTKGSVSGLVRGETRGVWRLVWSSLLEFVD
ncbi:hypothetical protein M409DRAFT_70822 [Zasmidium cellare ATCC 36951]|uniref:Galactose oxidase n=1 Tax=Zasmidium cellare ATCC 36951 TaxID=1080233 RepID=A0A6A6BYJ7_ZASCE|nr:uncharacterized protein M409DRAFT_70822 [Zasmidium cellare ATCC 36951]KAF2159775.1 hypothetical protein M409DRAFT_70822 [Zasmidium cellare ATCC 36951]